jgi:hypothetical protein
MRVRILVFASVLCAGACTATPPTPAPAPATPEALSPKVTGTLNHVMRGMLFPNSNIIFDVQDTDPGAPVTTDNAANPYAGTYGGWERVENASMVLAEAANLITLPGRVCQNGKPVPLDNEIYQKGVQALRDVAAEAYKAAQAKNQDAFLDVSDKVTQACSTCHDVVRDKVVDGKPIGMEDRCVE